MWTDLGNIWIQTHEWGNLVWGRAIPRKGIHKWDFRCSVKSFIEKLKAKFSDCPCTNNSLDLGEGFDRGAEGVEVHCVQEDWRFHCLPSHSLNHRVYRMPGFQSSELAPPNPLTRKRELLPPLGPRGRHAHLRGRAWPRGGPFVHAKKLMISLYCKTLRSGGKKCKNNIIGSFLQSWTDV